MNSIQRTPQPLPDKINTPSHDTDVTRLIFALDATASRQPSWDRAATIQKEMFEATAELSNLITKLAYFRGDDECKVSRWFDNTADLDHWMRRIFCVAGETQIANVLKYTLRETYKNKINALIFVGDAIEEDKSLLYRLAGQLGSVNVPIFMLQEGNDAKATPVFMEIARLSRGARLKFDLSQASILQDLLGAIAVFATGNRAALQNYATTRGGEGPRLIARLRSGGIG